MFTQHAYASKNADMRYIVRRTMPDRISVEAYEGSVQIGYVKILADVDAARVGYSFVVPEYRRQGLGTKLYERAAKAAQLLWKKPLASDTLLSPEAETFWEKQRTKKRAELVRTAGGNPQYRLKYPPPKSLRGLGGTDIWGDAMVSPDGKVYNLARTGLSHPDWAHENRLIVKFRGTTNVDYEPESDSDLAVFDDDQRIALDYFMEAGWIRVKWPYGIEADWPCDSVDLIKSILRRMAKENKGGVLHVDGGDGYAVPVSMTGRPDFSALDACKRT